MDLINPAGRIISKTIVNQPRVKLPPQFNGTLCPLEVVKLGDEKSRMTEMTPAMSMNKPQPDLSIEEDVGCILMAIDLVA